MQEYIVFASWTFVRFVYSKILAIFEYTKNINQHASILKFDVCFLCIVVICEEKNQIEATQCFIEHVISSTCFGHVYANRQDLVTIMLVWHVACISWLVVVRRSGAGRQAMRPG